MRYPAKLSNAIQRRGRPVDTDESGTVAWVDVQPGTLSRWPLTPRSPELAGSSGRGGS